MFSRFLPKIRNLRPLQNAKSQQNGNLYNWPKFLNLEAAPKFVKPIGICASVVGTIGLVKLISQKYNLTANCPVIEGSCEPCCFKKSPCSCVGPPTICPEKEKRKPFVRDNPLALCQAVKQSRDIVNRLKDEVGIPGLVVAVSVDGYVVWEEGFGYSDIEKRVPMCPKTVIRIASISKAITMTIIARLLEAGKIDLDKEVQYYVPSFPTKTFQCEKVCITPRHLVSHLSGIRHYEKCPPLPIESTQRCIKSKRDHLSSNDSSCIPPVNICSIIPPKEPCCPSPSSSPPCSPSPCSPNSCPPDPCCPPTSCKELPCDVSKSSEQAVQEFYMTKRCCTVQDALNIFKDDPLIYKPGCKFLYSTYGYVLLSAVAEGAVNVPFPCMAQQTFKMIGMCNTYLDEHDKIIPLRSNFYMRDKCRLVNAPYVDNSCKWASSGFLSTAADLIKFGNAMLYSFQYKPLCPRPAVKKCPKSPLTATCPSKNLISMQCCPSIDCNDTCGKSIPSPAPPTQLPGILKQETVRMMWSPIVEATSPDGRPMSNEWYGMGWGIVPESQNHAFGRHQQFYATHCGGAPGASSVLLILPREEKNNLNTFNPPKGVVVSILTNLSDVQLKQTALCLAKTFEKVTCIPEKFKKTTH